MNTNDYNSFFQNIAVKHKAILHNAPIAGGKNRKSFFVNINDEDIRQAAGNQINYPYLTVPAYSGRLVDNSVIDNIMVGRFEVRQKVKNALDFEGINNAWDQCFNIAMQIMAYMYRLMEDEGNAGPITNLNINTVRYAFTGPVNDAEYGCICIFEFMDLAWDPFGIDLNDFFNN